MFLSNLTLIVCLAGYVLGQATENTGPPAVNYVIERRGGAFAPNWTANLPYLLDQLKFAESRFNFTRREVKGNKIVRVPKERAVGGGEVGKLIGEFGRNGSWYARLRIGTPPQKIQLDLDMLTRDFAITTTSSPLGSRFEDFFSGTYAENPLKIYPFPNCGFPGDTILLPTVNQSSPLSFAHCKPRRQSRDTLGPSGAIFGLAPSGSLSQMGDSIPAFISQLVESKFIKEEVFSLTLISGEQGILSLGGTIQEQIATVESRIEGYLGKPDAQLPVGQPMPAGATDGVNPMSEAAGGPVGAPDVAAETAGDRAGLAPFGQGAPLQQEQPGVGALPNAPPSAQIAPVPPEQQQHDGGAMPVPDPNAPLAPGQAAAFPAGDAGARTAPQPGAAIEGPAAGAPVKAKRDVSGELQPAQELNAGLLLKRQDGLAEKVPTFEDMNPYNRAGRMKLHGQNAPSWKDGWKWSPVEGAAGWWQILMRGIWADQVKVMKNQPCIIDLNTPFILAPPLAAKAFYQSISGSYRLPEPYSNFYAYPCNNPPYLHFEFGGWRFPVMRGTKSSTEHRGANGKFSLGKVSDDSGYCVGAVVETRMGVGDASPARRTQGNRESFHVGYEAGMLAGNGLRDVWVLGEPVFRGMGLVFDMKSKEVGFRTY